MDFVKLAGFIGFVGMFFGAFVCWVIATVNMFQVVANRKEGVPLFPHWWESPFNVVFRPQHLTDRGLAARRRCFYGTIGFIVFWLLGAAIGLVTGVAH